MVMHFSYKQELFKRMRYYYYYYMASKKYWKNIMHYSIQYFPKSPYFQIVNKNQWILQYDPCSLITARFGKW